jgi:predicted MFS family arabinose efflux permease
VNRTGWPLVFALAVAQLVSWGSVYYSFSLFVVPMEAELGWSLTQLNGALSFGLLLSGVAAYPVGAWIDRGGGRAVMSLGSALAVVLLAAWSRVTSLGAFYAIWVGLGLALSATLYEPAFAVMTRLHPESYRTRITALTLVGGFASTVFIPVTQLAIGALGWRDALVVLALANLVFCLPVHALMLRDRAAGPAPARGAVFDAAVRRAFRHRVFWALVLCITAYYAAFAAITFHIIPLLEERHVPTATVIGAVAVFGPAQVAGRIALLALGRRATASLAGRAAFVAFPLSVAVLILFPRSIAALFVFSVLYGAANGIVTVVRGTAVPELLWRESYGAINGALTLPQNLARAAAPYGAAVIWRGTGSYDAVLYAILAGGIVAAIGFWYASREGGTAAPPH